MRRYKKRRGQVAVFYALMIPIFLLVGGVGLDLGWYYLNVSRLQNAADASVIVGARKLISSGGDTFENYKAPLLVYQYPADRPDTTTDTTEGDKAAADYTLKNLSSDTKWNKISAPIIVGRAPQTFLPVAEAADNEEPGESDSSATTKAKYTMKDNYSRGGDSTITMTPSLYKEGDNYFYVIHLTEDIHHFFIGFLDDMNAGVVAVARLSKDHVTPEQPVIPRDPGVGAEGELPEGSNILNEIYKLEDVTAIRNWEWQDWYKSESVTYNKGLPKEYDYLEGQTVHPKADYKAMTNGKDIYSGNWQQIQDSDKKVHYNQGDHYRTETATVKPDSNENKRDSINFDFNPDLEAKFLSTGQFTEDWDIGYPTPEGKALYKLQNKRSNSQMQQDEDTFKLRIHSTFNFETPYKVRSKTAANNPEDALYGRIESEPIIPLPFIKNQSTIHSVYSTVRQIILNINQSNMAENERPLVLYYSGPEQINPKDLDENGKHKRDSQPVILNLNADARVILFAPNSPVVVNGNGHKMQGFVIAKEFVQLTTASDYVNNGGRYFDKNDSTKEYFFKADEHGNNMFIDEYGNVQTKPLTTYDVRDPDYIDLLKNDTDRSEDYVTSFRDSAYYTQLRDDPNYANCTEIPSNTGNIGYLDPGNSLDVETALAFEKVYKLNTAFNLSPDSYYDSFNITELERNVYTYLDNYKDDDKTNSVDMFFTKVRASWVD
ncbi:MAG: Tad domain-containing protein [Selenomonadaceae bacterium]|nr:Tad domain-containing protein [Selenomonadaceae bacterium]